MTIGALMLERAFPATLSAEAREAARIAVRWVVPGYDSEPFALSVAGESVQIPARIRFSHGRFENPAGGIALNMANCLMTRSTDGYARQAALRAIVGLNQAWSVPFVVALIGEYVSGILDDIEAELPNLDRAAISAFLIENPRYFALTRARGVSYWNVYQRRRVRWDDYVGSRLLKALEAMTVAECPI
jgi:hypothetical protein